MKQFSELLENNENKLVRRIGRLYIPTENEVKDIKELAELLEVSYKGICIMSKSDMYMLSSLMFMLGKDAGKKVEREKLKEKAKAV